MPPFFQKSDRVRLALNLFDVDRIDPTIRQLLLAGKLDLSSAIKVDPDRMDETAVAFSCDLITAACICDTLRAHDKKAKDYPTRVYRSRGRGWAKLPGHALLTLVDDGVPVLNPAYFSSEVRADDLIPPTPQRVVF